MNEEVYFSAHFLNTRYSEVCLHFHYNKHRICNHKYGVTGSVLCTNWCLFPFLLGGESRRSLEEKVAMSVTGDKNIQHGWKDMVVRNTAALSSSITIKFLFNEITKGTHSSKYLVLKTENIIRPAGQSRQPFEVLGTWIRAQETNILTYLIYHLDVHLQKGQIMSSWALCPLSSVLGGSWQRTGK